MFVLGDVAQIALESTLDELQELTNFYLARIIHGRLLRR